MSEYISVTEFARRAGVSRQSVYKHMSTDCKPYVNVVDGKKRINVEALRIFGVNESVNQDNRNSQQVDSETVNFDATMIQLLQGQIEFLTEQLQAKDEQIAALQQALDQQQRLQAAAQQQVAQLTDKSQTAPFWRRLIGRGRDN